MYVPKKYDWIATVATIMTGFAIGQHYGTGWDVITLTRLPLTFIACAHAAYLWKAGILYQAYETSTGAKKVRTDTECAEEAEREWIARHPQPGKITDGNVNVFVPNPAMEEHQYTAETVTADEALWRLRRNIKRVCKRQFTYRDHLGMPDGDYRETSWVGELSREAFKDVLSVLEFAGGITRAGERRNSTYKTLDWNVIQLGAHGNPLPLPLYLQRK